MTQGKAKRGDFPWFHTRRRGDRRRPPEENLATNGHRAICLAPHRGNLILACLLDRLHLGVCGMAGASFVAFSLGTIFLNFLSGTLLPTPAQPNALLTLRWATHFTMVPLLVPILSGVVVVIYRRIPRMFEDLILRGVLSLQDKRDSFFADLQRWYESRAMNLVVSVFLLVLASSWAIINSQYPAAWTHSVSGMPTMAGLYWILIGCVGLYVLLHLAFAILLTFYAVKVAFTDTRRFKIDIRFMHPDRCGGLRPISDLALRVVLLLTVVGLALSIFILTCCYRLGSIQATLKLIGPVVAIAGYLIVGPVVFFLPLLPAHRLMRDMRRKYQGEIRHELDMRFGNAGTRIIAGQLDAPELSDMVVLSSLQRHVDAFPVWPFDMGTIRRFVSMVLLPLLPIAGGYLQPFFTVLSNLLLN